MDAGKSTQAILGTVTAFPAPAPGHRLVPATIGRPGATQVAGVQCPTWCEIDHLDERVVAIEDIDHYSPVAGWAVDSMLSPGEQVHELYVRVHADPAHPDERLRTAHVLLGNGAPFDSYLTPDAAEQTASELEAFAAHIRAAAHTARTARLHNEQLAGVPA